MEKVFAELRDKHGVELGDELGRGGFGMVFRARVSGVACAIKISLDRLDSSGGGAAKELKSLEQAKSVSGHPHVVTLFDMWHVQGHLVTRWELAQQSLADLGLAKFVGASSRGHTKGVGTLGYRPPEADKEEWTSSSDLYSLVATYVKLRTGNEPFGTELPDILGRQRVGARHKLPR